MVSAGHENMAFKNSNALTLIRASRLLRLGSAAVTTAADVLLHP